MELQDFIDMLEQQLQETGRDLSVSARDVASYAAERATHLSTLVNDADFMQAVAAERDSIALKAGIAAVDNADAIDNRIVGIIQGAISFGARLLA